MRRRWWLVVLGCVAVVVAGITFADAQSGEAPRGSDPLAPAEQTEALTAVDATVDDPDAESTGAVAGEPDEVVLLVERHLEDKEAAEDLRRADVYVYDYASNTLTISVVDLGTGEVDRSDELTGQQLPLIAEEGDRALTLALDDPDVLGLLEDQFAEVTGQTLTDPATQLTIDPIVFLARSMPETVEGAAAQCGVHRCAQLLIRTTDGSFLIDVLPIIDLSSDQVVSEDGFFS